VVTGGFVPIPEVDDFAAKVPHEHDFDDLCECEACIDEYFQQEMEADGPLILTLDEPKALKPVPALDQWVVRHVSA
jgi:hypothetical protein